MYKKQPSKERKMASIKNGMQAKVNITNRNQLKKLEKIKIDNEIEQVPLHEVYMRFRGQWHFKGFSCRYCDSLMTDQRVIDKHRYICASINKKNGDDYAST